MDKFDIVGFMIAFEDGDCDRDTTIYGFQQMINDGSVWKLQGAYGRLAQQLIERGYCHPKGD